MNPKVLIRPSLADDDELKSARYYFPTVSSRILCRKEFIIPRYSLLPLHNEVYQDFIWNQCECIETKKGFEWIKDFEWYDPLQKYTPKTYFSLEEFIKYALADQQYVVKGRTNSKKFQWNKLMWAKNKQDAQHIYYELMYDSLLVDQSIIFREYVPLKRLDTLIAGLPVSNEWRVFCYKDIQLCSGFYWTEMCDDDIIKKAQWTKDAECLIKELLPIVSGYCSFPVLDIAETETGEWILVEINSGCQSGLSGIDPDLFYKRLREVLCG